MVQGPQFSPLPGKSSVSSASTVSPSVQKHLSSESFRSVLAGLGLRSGDIKGITVQKGLPKTVGLNDVRLIHLSQDTAQALSALGIPNAEVAIALQGNMTLSELRKKLRQIRKSMLDSEGVSDVFSLLDVPTDTESLLIVDSEGGVTVIQKGLQDIYESL